MTRDRRLALTLGLNLVLVAVQVVFGLVAHSLGLLSDAGHNLTDVAAVITSLVAVRWARRSPTAERSYGYHRGTILAALVNATSILAITVFIVWEGVGRLRHPHPVEGGIVVVVALVAFALNAGSALLLHEQGGHGGPDLNMRSALVHMAGDALASLGVAAAGAVILATGGWYWLDPVASMGVALLIAYEAFRLVRSAAEILLESTPRDVDLEQLSGAVRAVDGVDGVHDLHVWSLSSDVRALSAHVVLSGHPTLEEAQVVGERVRATIAAPFSISHATLELECEACADGDADCVMDTVLSGTDERHGHAH